jgi:hypothetical protein
MAELVVRRLPMYPMIKDLQIDGDTLVLILVVLGILVLLAMLFHYKPWVR